MTTIVHIVRQFKPSIGGLEDAVMNLCLCLRDYQGVRIRVVTLNRLFSDAETILPASENIDGIDVVRVKFFGSSKYPIAPAVLNHIKDADLVHVHAVDFFYDFLALTKFWHRKPLVASTHGGFFHTDYAAKLKKIYFQTFTRLSSLAYSVICGSSDNDTSTFSEIASSKCLAIENGVNIDKWNMAGSESPCRTLIFIGRWSINKRVPELIKIMSELKELNKVWQLLIVGVEAHENRETLMAYAEEKGISDSVKIFENPSDEEIRGLICQASYITSASDYEGFGLTIVEGLSAGLWPLLSHIPPFEKIMKKLSSSLYIEENHPELTAKRLEDHHLELEKNYREKQDLCRSIALDYSWQGVAERFYDCYRRVLKEEPA